MNISTFWELIAKTKRDSEGDIKTQIDLLTRELASYAPEDIIDFDVLLEKYHHLAYTNELWAAIYIINGGCSNDTFLDFRHWLIAQGETIYQAALHDPTTLSEVIGGRVDRTVFSRGQQFGAIAEDAYMLRTDGLTLPNRASNYRELSGREWTDDDLPGLYPTLWARYG